VSDKTMIEVKLKGRSSMSQDNKLWEKRPLSEDILKYASIDVLVLFKLYDASQSTAMVSPFCMAWRISSIAILNFPSVSIYP
jgi:hypothetical protein